MVFIYLISSVTAFALLYFYKLSSFSFTFSILPYYFKLVGILILAINLVCSTIMEKNSIVVNSDIINIINLIGLLIITISKDKNEKDGLILLRFFLFFITTIIVFFIFLLSKAFSLWNINSSSSLFLPICILFTYSIVYNISEWGNFKK